MGYVRAVGAFAGLAGLWGLTVTVMQLGFASFPPLLLSAFRYYLGGILLLGYVVWRTDDWWPRTRGDVAAISGGGVFWIAIGNGVWFVGQELTTSVLSGLMMSLIPIATAAFSWVVIPEDRLTPVSLAGLFISFIGAVLLFWPITLSVIDDELVGKGLLLVGVLGAAIGGVLLRWAPARLSRPAQTTWSVLIGAVIVHWLSLAVGEQWTPVVTPVGIAALVYLGVLGTVVAYLLFFSLFDRHSAIEVSLVTYLVPVVAATGGWVAFGEEITLPMVGGFVVIVTGFALMKRRELGALLAEQVAAA